MIVVDLVNRPPKFTVNQQVFVGNPWWFINMDLYLTAMGDRDNNHVTWSEVIGYWQAFYGYW